MSIVEPVSVALKFGILGVLYAFLVWVARSGMKDLGRGAAATVGATDIGDASPAGPAAPRLVVERAPGHEHGMEYDIGDGAVMGRGTQAEIRLEDPYASGKHARLQRQGGTVVVEDLGSTNGTFLNEEPLAGAQPLHEGDRIRIGDSEFVYVVH